MPPSREFLALVGVFVLAVGLRVARLDQPIVENYVGRQIPTAMVARGLVRGTGFLSPQLETAPPPNYFLVEPPIFAWAASRLHRWSGLALEPAGRLVSVLGIALSLWGIHGLVRRRLGARTALLSVLAFSVFPVTIRYGRAFQPDALMVGLLTAGLRCWDEFEAGGGVLKLGLGWCLLALGLATKVVAAFILIPLWLVIFRPRWRWKVGLSLLLLIPAFAWYGHAASLMARGAGSRAASDNSLIWLRVLVPTALLHVETWHHVLRFVIRSFTPFGLLLALLGTGRQDRRCQLFQVWSIATLAGLAMLAAKLHHEYYWLMFAPVLAVWTGRGLNLLFEHQRGVGWLGCLVLGFLCLAQARSTWRTPPDWTHLNEGAQLIQAHVPTNAWLVAPEALLYASDRRGCRLELTRRAAKRAAGEWGKTLEGDGPLALIEFYRMQGVRYVADLVTTDPARLALHDAIRGRYKVVVDRHGVLLAVLIDSQEARDVNF